MIPQGPAPRHWLSRLDDVRRTGDRRAALPLTELLIGGALDDDVLDDVADVLASLEDPRTYEPLLATLLERTAPRDVRHAALRVLSALPMDDPPVETIHAWVAARDPLLRAFGATFLEPVDGERLAVLVRDPEVVVRRAAVESLVAAARTPELVAAVRSALRDSDGLVREVACRAALFDEPLAATYDLLHLLDDRDGDVRAGVYDVLEDYPSVSVVLALADARSGPEGPLAESALELLLHRVRAAMDDAPAPVVRRIGSWAAPIAWLLEETHLDDASPDLDDRDAWGELDHGLDDDRDDDAWSGASSASDAPAASTEADHRRPPVPLADAERVLLDADTPARLHRELLARHDWARAGGRGLVLLREMATSPAWSVRHGCAVALLDLALAGDQGAVATLREMASDPEAVVRRIAIHALTHLRDFAVVDLAAAVLADPRARPLAGDAALQAVAQLAGPERAAEAVRTELRTTPDRDGLLLGAIHLAERMELRDALPDLVAVVDSPVVCGVAQHVAALRAIRVLGGEVDAGALGHLERLDHLDLQAELGAWDWHDRRYG